MSSTSPSRTTTTTLALPPPAPTTSDVQLVGGGCFVSLFQVDDLVGQTIASFLTLQGALATASTCRAVARLASSVDVAVLKGITFKHLRLLYPQLPRFQSLRVLSLSGNHLSNQGAQALAQAIASIAATRRSTHLPSSTGLEELVLSGCGIGADGCAALVQAFHR